jgi:hypothetical protein
MHLHRYLVPAVSQLHKEAALGVPAGLENVATIGFESSDQKISALPPSLLARVVASLYESGAVSLPNGSCVLGPNSIEMMLLPSSMSDNKGSKRMRLQMADGRVVLALDSGADDSVDISAKASNSTEADGHNRGVGPRRWRVDAYMALHAALTCAVRDVFGALSVRACTWCAACSHGCALDVTICPHCTSEIDKWNWLPDNDRLIKARQKTSWTEVAKGNDGGQQSPSMPVEPTNPLVKHFLKKPKWLLISIVGSAYTGLAPLSGSARAAEGFASCVHHKLSALTFTPIKADKLDDIDIEFDARAKLVTDKPAVVLYMSGHGRKWSDFFVLLLEGSDGETRRFDVRNYVGALFEKGASCVILVVDACHAGAADELAASLSYNRQRLHIFMSSSSDEKSYEVVSAAGKRFSLFTGALCVALGNLTRMTDVTSSTLFAEVENLVLSKRNQKPAKAGASESLALRVLPGMPQDELEFFADLDLYFGINNRGVRARLVDLSGKDDDKDLVRYVRDCLLDDEVPLIELTLTLRAFVDAKRATIAEASWLASMQFGERSPSLRCSDMECCWLQRVSGLVGGVGAIAGDAEMLKKAAPLLASDRAGGVPIELYEAVKGMVDKRVQLDMSFSALIQLLETLESAAVFKKLNRDAGDSVRACAAQCTRMSCNRTLLCP